MFKLRDRLRNEESINYHLRENRVASPADDRFDRSFEECLQHIDQNSDCESRQSTAVRLKAALKYFSFLD